MADIVLDSMDKVYENGFVAVQDLDLTIEDGEFLVLVGPSGCGKSTALRMVAGLEDITAGELRIGGERMNEVPPRDRDIAMVFQSYALYPHLTVYDNIAFGLKLRKLPKGEIRQRVEKAGEVLGLTDYLDRKPKALSGGQRQRVAMGRAIVREPQAFLMDEPLSNLDAKLRVQMRAEIARLQKELGVTTLYVTHDQVEAMTMGDRVAVIKRGVLQQVDTPRELYLDPDNVFIGAFMGSPPMNLGVGTIIETAEGLGVQIGQQTLVIDAELLGARPALRRYVGRQIVVGFRPEDIHHPDEASDLPSTESLQVTVELVEALGSELMAHFTVDSPVVRTNDLSTDSAPIIGGSDVPEKAMWVALFNPRTFVKVADDLHVLVDTAHMYAFDIETGAAIRT